MKTCIKCKIPKLESEFTRCGANPPRSLQLKPRCKSCASEGMVDRYWKNPELFRERSKKSKLLDPERVAAYAKLYNKKYLPIKRVKKRTPEYKEVRNTSRRERYASDVLYKLGVNLRSRLGGVIRTMKGQKNSRSLELLGCSIDWLKAHLESNFKTGMTWENHGPVWEIDHVKPCAKFDLADPKQQKACFHWTNFQPLFVEENRKKGCKYG